MVILKIRRYYFSRHKFHTLLYAHDTEGTGPKRSQPREPLASAFSFSADHGLITHTITRCGAYETMLRLWVVSASRSLLIRPLFRRERSSVFSAANSFSLVKLVSIFCLKPFRSPSVDLPCSPISVSAGTLQLDHTTGKMLCKICMATGKCIASSMTGISTTVTVHLCRT